MRMFGVTTYLIWREWKKRGVSINENDIYSFGENNAVLICALASVGIPQRWILMVLVVGRMVT